MLFNKEINTVLYNTIIRFIALSIFFLFTTVTHSQQQTPRIGLVLSGGGAKGIAHIGVLRELEKKGIKPDYIVGTSIGALIGGLYAVGYSPDQLEEIVKTNDWDFLLNDEIKRENFLIGQGEKNKNSLMSLPLDGIKPAFVSGLYQGQNILTLIEILTRKYNHEIDFDSLEIPFRCVATNIETGETKIFKKGKLADALRASMSIPSIFAPYKIDNELYVDGGLVNNLPADILKKMGAEIIIGVDVGAVLYRKEEINSILKILDQSASFYNARISSKNKKLCDIYLRPDIKGISAMDFSEANTIVNRGARACWDNMHKIDSVFSKYNLQPIINNSSSDIHHFHINNIKYKIDGYRKRGFKAVYGLIKGKLKLKTPCDITDKDFTTKINRVYGSRFFEKISTTFYPADSGYNIVLTVKEKTDDEFNIGVRYDSYYNINVMLGANFRNQLIYGSIIELKLVVGQNPQLKIRYTTDRGENIGFGTSAQLDNFFSYTYKNSIEFAKYNYKRLIWDVFMHRYYDNYNRAIIGLEGSIYGLSSTQSIADVADFTKPYGRLFIANTYDTWDRSYFPNQGTRAKGRADLTLHNETGAYLNAWEKTTTVISINNKLKVETDVFIGYGSSGTDTTQFKYMIGGMQNSRIEWYNSFHGLMFLEKGGSNTWQFSIAPRWEIFNNSFLTYRFSIAAFNPIFEKLLFNPGEIYSGMSLQYGYNSMFGPLTLTVDYSLLSKHFGTFVSLGYWF